MKTLLTLIINENENGEKFIDVMYNGYNIIKQSIYNDKIAKKVIDTLKDELLND